MLGEKVAMPVAIGPTGMCGAVWSNGEILSCRAAHDFGIPFSLSTNALLSIEDVASSVDQPFWFQLYLEKDRGFSKELLERAKAAGCPVLILTMDLHVEGTRYCDVHNGLGVPPKLTPANIWSIVTPSALGVRDAPFQALELRQLCRKGEVAGTSRKWPSW